MCIPNYKFNDDFEKYNNIFKENYVVGLQIRTEFLNSDDIEIFTKCAFGIEKNYLNKNTNHKSVKWQDNHINICMLLVFNPLIA